MAPDGASGVDRAGGSIESVTTSPQHETQVLIAEPLQMRPGHFCVWHRERQIIDATRMPMCDGCRALIEAGVDPGAIVVMRHMGSATDALRAKAGVAATLTVDESRTGAPKFRKHRPWRKTRPPGGGTPPCVRSAAPASPQIPGAANGSA